MKKKQNGYSLFILIFAAIGGFVYGYDLGVISGALLFIKKDIFLTSSQTSMIVAAVLGGGSIATLISGTLADWLGRKKMIFLSAIIVIIGSIVLAGAYNFETLLLGRLIQGISVGVITIVIPLYLAEAAPKRLRGRNMATFQLVLTGGILIAYTVNLFFADTGNWRGMFLCTVLPGTLLFAGAFFIPESPVWLFAQNKKEKAKATLIRLRGEEEAELEIREMEDIKEKTHASLKKFSWQPHYFMPLFIALSVACLNQLTGINIILQYSTIILKDAGLKTAFVSMLGSTGIGLINFVSTILALFLVDKIGRKPLLTIGTAGICISLFFSGFISAFITPSNLKGFLLLGSMVSFIFFFAIGPGVVVWLAVSELLPSAIRSKGMGVTLFFNSLVSAIFASIFLDLINIVGYSGTFWLCSALTLLYFLVAAFLLPETKDKTLEEIEEQFRLKKL